MIVLLIFILLKCNNKEHAENISIMPNEAIQNLASMYNNEKIITSKLQLSNPSNLTFENGQSLQSIIDDIKNDIKMILKNLMDVSDNAVRKDRKYGILSPRGGYLSDQGGWKGKPNDPTNWEVMRFDELQFK